MLSLHGIVDGIEDLINSEQTYFTYGNTKISSSYKYTATETYCDIVKDGDVIYVLINRDYIGKKTPFGLSSIRDNFKRSTVDKYVNEAISIAKRRSDTITIKIGSDTIATEIGVICLIHSV